VIELNRCEGIAINTRLQLCPVVCRCLELVNGQLTLDEIFRTVVTEQGSQVTRQEVETRFHAVFNTLRKTDLVLMRHRSVPLVGI